MTVEINSDILEKYLLPLMQKTLSYTIESALLGLAIGDALGVPVEFKSREYLRMNPVKDLIGYGTHHQPPGTFSDDSSLTFCLAESLSNGYNIADIAEKFLAWAYGGYWTAHGDVFDIGIATQQALSRIAADTKPEFAGGFDDYSNGNGSLMRILPLVFYLLDKPIEDRFTICKQVSSITHAHIRSVIACFYYLEFARKLVLGEDKFQIYEDLKKDVGDYLVRLQISFSEVSLFSRLLTDNIHTIFEDEINSSGYVLHTLEASIWCLLTCTTYPETVLKAVNLGSDTDTTAAVAGGLAGILYGHEQIPENWKEVLARKEDIMNLSEGLTKKLKGKG